MPSAIADPVRSYNSQPIATSSICAPITLRNRPPRKNR